MANDFKAKQIRTTQIIASGSNGSGAAILLYGSSSATNNTGGFSSAMTSSVGSDVFLFVSGSAGSKGSAGGKGVTLFGGDVVASGSVFASKISGSLTQLDTGVSYLVAGSNVTIVTGSNGQVRISSAGGSGSPGGSDAYVQFNDGGSFGGDSGLTYNKTTKTLVVTNLSVTGTITSVSSSNLVISDPVLYIASGSPSSNTNGGIAIASGSSTASQALVWGRVATDTWGAGRLDVTAGTVTDLTSMTLVPIRASKYDIGGSSAALTSSSGQDVILYSGGGSFISLVPGSIGLRLGSTSAPVAITGSDVRIGSSSTATSGLPPHPGNDSYLFVSGAIGSRGTSNRGTSVFGGDVLASGSISAVLGLTGSLTKLVDGRSYLVAGSNIVIESGSNGQVRFSAPNAGAAGVSTEVQFNNGAGGFDSDATFTYDSGVSRLTVQKITANDDVVIVGGLDVNGGYLNTSASSFSLLSSTVSTVSFATVATSLTMGTGSGATIISGSVKTPNGISGSLTQLTDGRSYLVAGSNVTISSASNGQVTISSTGGGGSSRSLFTDPSNSQINATGSLALAGTLGTSYVATNAGTGVYLFVSGNIGTTSVKSSKIALFGGDVVTSGSIFLEDSSGYTQINQNSGNLSIRNRSLAGQLVASVNTSIGNTVNFLDVRPNGMAVNTKVAILPSVFAGPANPFNSSDTSFFIGGAPNTKNGSSGGTTVVGGDFLVSGSTYIGNSSANTLYVSARLGSDIIPDGNRTRNLGSDTARFANIYTGDLHLRNERGDYTLIEEEDCLTIRFNKTGKRYRFLLEAAPEFDEK